MDASGRRLAPADPEVHRVSLGTFTGPLVLGITASESSCASAFENFP